jgi:hypothetical protein
MSPISSLMEGHARKYVGGFRVLSQQSQSASNRPNTAGQNGAIVNQAARPSSAGERHGTETLATTDKAPSGARKDWLDYATAFLTLAAAGGAITAAVFTGWQAITADQGLRASNRAYVHSTSFRFVHYGAKNESGRTQWSVSPLIENTGNTGTRGMLINSIVSSAGEPDFDSLEKAAFSPALILPKSEMTGAVFSMDGRALDLMRGGGLITMGIVKYADIFGDLHLVEFCHRAQFGTIDWEGMPAGQPLRIRGIACETHNCEDNECGPDWHARATAVASRRPETSNMRREAGIIAGAAAQR